MNLEYIQRNSEILRHHLLLRFHDGTTYGHVLFHIDTPEDLVWVKKKGKILREMGVQNAYRQTLQNGKYVLEDILPK